MSLLSYPRMADVIGRYDALLLDRWDVRHDGAVPDHVVPSFRW